MSEEFLFLLDQWSPLVRYEILRIDYEQFLCTPYQALVSCKVPYPHYCG